jgi:hypothetical protein
MAAGRLLPVREVSSRERHRFGSVTLLGDAIPGHVARVTPLETWQWLEAGAEGPLPLSFAGPMGRYSVAVLDPQDIVQQQTFEIRAGMAIQVRLAVGQTAQSSQGKKKPWLLGAVGAAGAGAAAFLLASLGGNGESSPSSNGGIFVRVPRWHP